MGVRVIYYFPANSATFIPQNSADEGILSQFTYLHTYLIYRTPFWSTLRCQPTGTCTAGSPPSLSPLSHSLLPFIFLIKLMILQRYQQEDDILILKIIMAFRRWPYSTVIPRVYKVHWKALSQFIKSTIFVAVVDKSIAHSEPTQLWNVLFLM